MKSKILSFSYDFLQKNPYNSLLKANENLKKHKSSGNYTTCTKNRQIIEQNNRQSIRQNNRQSIRQSNKHPPSKSTYKATDKSTHRTTSRTTDKTLNKSNQQNYSYNYKSFHRIFQRILYLFVVNRKSIKKFGHKKSEVLIFQHFLTFT